MLARAPASSANLGPGFDTLAVALGLYTEVEVEPAGSLHVHAEGEGSDLPADAGHLAARVATSVVGHDRLHITVRSQVPVSRGLGSSAALAVAAAAAAGADDPLAVAAAFEGHPENAAASVLGGLVTATFVGSSPVAAPLTLDPAITYVVLVPGRPLATERARAALPAHVPHTDAAFNLGRMGLLIAGLGDHRQLVREATDDRLHQTARGPLFPEAAFLLAGLLDAGALASCWSGAGPSLLAFCLAESVPTLVTAGRRLLQQAGIGGQAIAVRPDLEGLEVGAQPRVEAVGAVPR
ncbi:MAG TPA: homoserine kinase [Acidimicrobiales bacterium]